MAAKTAAKTAATRAAAVDSDITSESKAGFVWKPKDGSSPIELPYYDTVRPKGKTMWFEYQIHKRAYSLVAQFQFAMDCAEIPEATQDRVFNLPDDELAELLNGWVRSVAGGASLGES